MHTTLPMRRIRMKHGEADRDRPGCKKMQHAERTDEIEGGGTIAVSNAARPPTLCFLGSLSLFFFFVPRCLREAFLNERAPPIIMR